MEYPLVGRARGHYRTGPLMVRTTDPFGLVRLDRTFSATSEVVVTPQVHDLTGTAGGGSGGSAGEARPRRIGVSGADDVLVVVGGVIPPDDVPTLKEMGAAAVFPPGTVIADAAQDLLRTLAARLGH